MASTPVRRSPTGGQLNVSGILYQMLASLADGLDATVTALGSDGAGAIIELQTEPFDGGDYAVNGPTRHIVQVKRRAANRRWTLGDIMRDVLPDLLKAVRPGQQDAFQFLTDNDAGCEDFRRFLSWYRASAAAAPGEIVEDAVFRLGRGGSKAGGADVLEAVRAATGVEHAEDPRLVALLGSLRIVMRREDELARAVEQPLRILAERVEDAPRKRAELVGELMALGAEGRKVRTSELLRAAQLEPRRLVHAGQLAATLRHDLAATFPAFRYIPADDVRASLPAPTRSVTVLRGESGLGKSWRMCASAGAMAQAGRPVVLLRATADVDGLRARIASLVWNPTYFETAPLSSVADRLRPALADARGVWLTVFIDDLNDPLLAQAIIEDRWDRLGIDLVISSQAATAEWLRTSFAAPQMIDVQEFTTPELIAYLGRSRVDHSNVQDDVFALLHKPVLARLYVQLPHGLILSEETEYQLLQSFWDHTGSDRPASVAQNFDLDQLQLLVGDMLDAPPSYPWPPSSFVRTLDFDAVERLVQRGMIELDGNRRLSLTHDRLLNWTMARHISETARDRDLPPAAVLDLLRRVQGLQTAAGLTIGGRFGYVLMDLIWLLLGPGQWSPRRVAELLLSYMRDPDFDAYDRRFFRSMLPTLGARAAPLMRAMAEAGFGGDREALWPAWLAEGLRRAADFALDEVREATTAMFTSGDRTQAEIALRVFAKVAAPGLIGELHAINLDRAAALDATDADGRMDRIQAKERSFDAFAKAAAASPSWLDDRIAAAAGSREAEQLLWALLQLERGSALPIWQSRRDHLFAVIRDTARVLPKAVRVFADPADLPRLHLPPPDESDTLQTAMVFDAIARLDPNRALEILRADSGESELDRIGAYGWWMPGLHFRTRARLGAALRDRANSAGVTGSDGLAVIYGGHPELIDEETVDLLLDALESRLASQNGSTEAAGEDVDLPPDCWRLLWTLSSLRTASSLQRIAKRRGSPLEDALDTLAAGRRPSSSRVADRDGEMMARLLALMSGEGYDRLAVAQIASPGVTTREYGLGHALWTTSREVGVALDELAGQRDDDDQDRPFHLMQALAAHGGDTGIVRLIGASSPVYTNAVDIRQARGGDVETLAAEVSSRAASGAAGARLEAVDLSHFLPEQAAFELTAQLIEVSEPGDALATKLMMLHLHHARYDPALLPKIRPFLDGDEEAGRTAALHLALHSDAAGRAEASRWLAARDTGTVQSDCFQVALALLDHRDSRAIAIAFLHGVRNRRFHMGRLDAEILDALARNGDAVATEELVSLAYGTDARDLNAVAGAVRLVARIDAPGAFQAAKRLFARSGQQEAARLLIETDAAEGLTELVMAYVGAPLPKRIAIARTLRWNVPLERIAIALAGMAGAADEGTRAMAAEIAGWMPHHWHLPWLSGLAADPVIAVEEAALETFHRRAAGQAAVELMAIIPSLPKPAQWAYLNALIELVDPHLLLQPGDPLDVRPLIKQLPPEFGIEAQRLLDRRRQDVDRKVARDAKD